jgi:hypothetical protein
MLNLTARTIPGTLEQDIDVDRRLTAREEATAVGVDAKPASTARSSATASGVGAPTNWDRSAAAGARMTRRMKPEGADATTAAMIRFGVEIDAPDGIAAGDLEQRLLNLGFAAITAGPRWSVEVPGQVDPEAVQLVVRQWLNDIVEPRATMRIDGEELVVKRDRVSRAPRNRTTQDDFIRLA